LVTLKQLITPVSEADALATILSTLSQFGFQATSWQSGSIQLTMLSLFARIYSKLVVLITQFASGGFTTLATGDYLTLLAQYVYNITRLVAVRTQGLMLLTNSSAGVVTFNAGDIIVSTSPTGTPGAQTFTVAVSGSVGPGANSLFSFAANIAGIAGNIPSSSTLYLWTPIPGVAITNPVISGTSTWIQTAGADLESDSRLQARCLGAWARRTYSNIDGAYKGWALEALPTLTRVQILSAPGNGTVTLVGATSVGPISGSESTTIQNYINGITDGQGRRPLNDIFTAVGSTPVTTPALTATIYCTSDVVATAPAIVALALQTYIGTVPIGGSILTGATGKVLFDDLLDTAKLAYDGASVIPALRKVRSVALSITGDIPLTSGQTYQPAITVNAIPVAPGN
jgi:uncharacterized phage protein gp47/JayE